MSNSEFKARALYAFVAEGPNELSFNVNDVLTITSNTAGHGWWYAKSSSGQVGVIPENYVQALVDPPEPNEPPPPISTFSQSNNSYPTLDVFNNGSSTAKTSFPPPYDQHQYMNPATYTNNWQAPESPTWPSSPPATSTTRNSGRKESDSDDTFSDSEDAPSSSNAANMHTRPKQSPVHLANTLSVNSTMGNHGRVSMVGGEVAKGPPRARFFDKHGMDNYLLNGFKTKPDEHFEITGGWCLLVAELEFPPFSCKVEEPSKGTKLGGLKAFMEYKIHPQTSGIRAVGRRYKQFDWLHEQLANKFRFICIPPLPGKQIAGRFEQEFIEERRRQLELWLNRICRHPVLCASFPVQHFLTCESSDKNKKDWKGGKRKIEKDEFRDAPWLSCVVVKDPRGSDSIESQINAFAQQQPGLESQLKNLSQGLTKYIERHTEVYERDIQKISELFSKVHHAVQMDTATPGNRELSSSIQKISGSYGGIAELYKTKGSEGLRDFNERLQEYIGLLACFPSILSIQRSTSEFMKTVQNRGVADLTHVADRHQDLNHVVLAEINFFQREKVRDFNTYMKTVMDEQIQFYEKIAAELREASATFK